MEDKNYYDKEFSKELKKFKENAQKSKKAMQKFFAELKELHKLRQTIKNQN